MGSIFGIYSTAMTGIYTSQSALNVTSNNISNVDTGGYTRQRVDIEDNTPVAEGALSIGTGCAVEGISQTRSVFFDESFRDANCELGYWNAKNNVVSEIENILGDLSVVNISSSMDEFFSSWEALAKNPQGLAERAMVVEAGKALVDTADNIFRQLERIQKDFATQISDEVDEINDIADQIAQLNSTIMMNEAMGNSANDYRDQRNYLIDELSYMVDIDVREYESGMVSISIGGTYLVRGDDVNHLDFNCKSTGVMAFEWGASGSEVDLESGELLGLMDSVEQVNEIKEDISELVKALAYEVNSIHSCSTGLDGSSGVDFFVCIYEGQELGVGNIGVNPELEDLDKIAASSGGSAGENKAADEIASLNEKKILENGGLPVDCYDYYSLMVSYVGSTGRECEGMVSNQETLVGYIENQRDSISSVSLDEELVNMTIYQQTYNASSKVMNAIDEMIEAIMQMV